MTELTAVSRFVWESKYRGHTAGGPADAQVEDTWRRVARAVAAAEDEPGLWAERFQGLLSGMRFIPGGRVLAGAGTGRRVTLFNCFVARPPDDSLPGILDTLKESALTLQQGGGVGCDFSGLRPTGAPADASGAIASGPVSFMRIWDAMSATLMSTGSRRGAMMATLRCDHPDIEQFVDAKRRPATLQNFNLSVLISDAFMQALAAGGDWRLRFPAMGEAGAAGADERLVSAEQLWTRLCAAAHAAAEPGVLFIDRINRENNLYYRERISATNPCGEVPLPPYGACNLGSLNLVAFVRDPFTEGAALDEEAIRATARLAVRFLDNVIDVSDFPLSAQAEQARGARRVGLGVTGLADALIMLGLHYDSDQARSLAARVLRVLRDVAYQASVELAREKGPFSWLDRDHYLAAPFVARLDSALRRQIADHGIRNSHLLSIAPAGSISLLAGNVSSGIEPVFMLEGQRMVRGPDAAVRRLEVVDYAYAMWRARGGERGRAPASMVTAATLPGQAHLAMQASLQPFVDNAISKTINLPSAATAEDVSQLYRAAYEMGLKGCTVYRAGCLEGQVLDQKRAAARSSRSETSSALDADQRPQACHPPRQPGMLGGLDYAAHLLVGAGRLFGHAAERRTADDDTLLRELIHNRPATP
jgi:ribonucleoside-diphosphate reductase alpha chain